MCCERKRVEPAKSATALGGITRSERELALTAIQRTGAVPAQYERGARYLSGSIKARIRR
jgi:hypothetical protein